MRGYPGLSFPPAISPYINGAALRPNTFPNLPSAMGAQHPLTAALFHSYIASNALNKSPEAQRFKGEMRKAFTEPQFRFGGTRVAKSEPRTPTTPARSYSNTSTTELPLHMSDQSPTDQHGALNLTKHSPSY